MTNSKLFGRWILQNKENNGIKVYTDNESEIKKNLNTERDGFEIKENGEFIRFKIYHDGNTKEFKGQYIIEGNTLYSRFKNSYMDSMFIIVELNDHILRLQ